ncbi:MAG TPA: rRNA maturation RNase YbeY, partial [Lactobacillus sp.]|nr:rRNA maturation RNase YbeY [Lactobacillus sp.]
MDLELYDDDHLLDAQHHDLIQKLVVFCGQQLKLQTDTEMSITIVGDDDIQEINRKYRDTDRATDVISFAIEDGEDDLPLLP